MLLISYLVCMLFTLIYSGYKTGIELSDIKEKLNAAGAPPQNLQINYINIFFQGVCWPCYWAVSLSIYLFDKRKSE